MTLAMLSRSSAHLPAQASRIVGEHRRRLLDEGDGDAADAVLRGFTGHILDRRLAVDAREEKAGQERGGARLETGARLPGDAARDRRRRAVESGEEFAVAAGTWQALQEKMIEAEGEVEGGVAIPGAFGVEEDRAASGRS